MPQGPIGTLSNFTAATRKPFLIPFGFFSPGDNISWIYAPGGAGGISVDLTPVNMTGTIDGVNAAFTVPLPIVNGVAIFRNGDLQSASLAYSIVGQVVTFNGSNIPQIGDSLQCVLGSTSASLTPVALTGTINGINAVFIVVQAITSGCSIFRNGILQIPGSSYNIVGQTVTFTAGNIPQTGDNLAAIAA